MKQHLLFLVLFLTITISQSQTFNDGILEYTVTDAINDYVSVNKYNNTCPTGDLVIPKTKEVNGTTYTITNIEDNAFENCTGLTSAVIPNGVTSIGTAAFLDCSNLTNLTLGNNVASIGNEAFAECTSLTSLVIPDNVTTIGGSAFNNCFSITSLSLGNSLSSIGNYAFENCNGLTSVIIPDSVTSIGLYAFATCNNLSSISIGNGVTTIENHAFSGCISLTSVSVNWTIPLEVNENIFNNVVVGDIPLTVPSGTETSYQSTLVWQDFNSISSATLSTPEINVPTLQLYPNPVKDQFTVKLENNNKLENINIYNNLGQLVKQSKASTLNVSELNRGLYIIEIETNQGKSTKKLIIE